MEFRCRLASPNGEIVEGVYVAENEARLRHELEEKGLFVLSLQPKHAIAGVSLHLPQRQGINTREFLVFNQELATLLKAGMPLVQSLDLLKRRVTSPAFRRVLDDVHEKVRSGTALSDAFDAHGELFPRVYTASLLAGERSGNLDAMLRRYVEYTKIIATVKRKTVSALVYPAILISLALVLVTIIVLKVVPAFSDFYGTFGAELPLSHARHRRRLRVPARAVPPDHRRGRIAVVDRVHRVGAAAGTAGALRSSDPAACRCSASGAEVRDLADGADAGDAARRRPAAGQRARHRRRSIGNQYMAEQLDVVSSRVREGESFAAALEARQVFPEVAVKMAEVGESTGALQDMLNTVADFYDEEIATTMDGSSRWSSRCCWS